jgi:TatD DNase family protein
MIDSHCHLDFDIFDDGRASLIKSMQRVGVDRCIIPAVASASWDKLLQVTEQHAQCYPALGLHPYAIASHREEHLGRLTELLTRRDDIVAVGEIGLDSTLMTQYSEQQQYYFERQLGLAKEYDLPVIIHARGCYDQVAATIRRCRFVQGGIIHAFTGSLQQGQTLTGLGFKLGIGGAVTHPRAKKLRRTVAQLDHDNIVLETDSPDMKPAFLRKTEFNTPALLPMIAAIIAALRGESDEQVISRSNANILSALPKLK